MKATFFFMSILFTGFMSLTSAEVLKKTNNLRRSLNQRESSIKRYSSPNNKINFNFSQRDIPSVSQWLQVKKSYNLSTLEEDSPFENGFMVLLKDFFSTKSGDWKVQYQTSYGMKNLREIQIQQNPLLFEHRLVESYYLLYKGSPADDNRLVVYYDDDYLKVFFNSEIPNALKSAQELRDLIMNFHDKVSPFHGRALEFLPNGSVGFYKGIENYKYKWNDFILEPLIKNNLQSTVDTFLNNYNLGEWEKLGLPLNRGVLVHGPPGTGKSFLAKVLVSNVIQNRYKNKVSYIHVQSRHISSSDRIRTIYQGARLLSPAIVFFEDIDLIAGTGRFDRPSIKNELMQQLSGLESLKGVITIGSTNFFDRIDPALKRTKRLGFNFLIGLPKALEREQLIQIMLSKWSLDPQVSIPYWSQITEGFSGADLKELIDLAVESALREHSLYKLNKNIVLKSEHLEKALKIKNTYHSIQKKYF